VFLGLPVTLVGAAHIAGANGTSSVRGALALGLVALVFACCLNWFLGMAIIHTVRALDADIIPLVWRIAPTMEPLSAAVLGWLTLGMMSGTVTGSTQSVGRQFGPLLGSIAGFGAMIVFFIILAAT